LGKHLYGYKNINEKLENLGYIKGLSLFNIPYDFRFQIAEIMPKIQETIRLAYKINKKKVIVIGHSYGGLLSYKLSTLKEKELINHTIAIGAPFLGSFASIKNTFGLPDNFAYNKNINILGSNLGNIQTELPLKSMFISCASFNLLQFFPKDIKKDETYNLIKKIDKIEKFYSKDTTENISQINLLEKSMRENENKYSKEGFLNLFELNQNEKEVLQQFYSIFPLPYEKCKSIETNFLNVHLTENNNICKINYYDAVNKFYSKN
jgi:Lecithin:cholesterol acyltransferase